MQVTDTNSHHEWFADVLVLHKLADHPCLRTCWNCAHVDNHALEPMQLMPYMLQGADGIDARA